MSIMVSRHADDRIKERLGIKSERRRQELAETAFHEGIRISSCDRKTLKLILKNRQNKTTDYVVYREQLFVFDHNVLITVLPADNRYRRTMENRRASERRKKGKVA